VNRPEFCRLGGLQLRRVGGVALLMIEGLKFSRWNVANGAVQSPVIPPVDPLRGSEFDLLK
jgi:hypothetical protein